MENLFFSTGAAFILQSQNLWAKYNFLRWPHSVQKQFAEDFKDIEEQRVEKEEVLSHALTLSATRVNSMHKVSSIYLFK